MARYRRGRTNWGFVVVVSVLLAAVALVSLSDTLGLQGIPTWNELLEEPGMPENGGSSEDEVLGEEEPAGSHDPEAGASLHVIDVGQGDALLLQSPEGSILVDAGVNDEGPTVVAYLERLGVEKLDYVIATHPHADHIGGMAYVIQELEADHILAPKVPSSITPTSRAYRDMLAAIKDKGLKIQRPKPGETFDLGDGASFTVLGPTEADDEMNNNSVVVRFTYGEVSFLLTGDCEKDMEKKILAAGGDLSADVLKVGHHGSSTSTSPRFLEAVSPDYAAISCGLGNDYGHPHKETVQALKDAGVKTYRTDLDGTIVFFTDGQALWVETQR